MKTFIRTCGNLSTTAFCENTGLKLGNTVGVDIYKEGEAFYLRLTGIQARGQRRKDFQLSTVQKERLDELNSDFYQSQREAAYAFDLLEVQTIFNEQ